MTDAPRAEVESAEAPVSHRTSVVRARRRAAPPSRPAPASPSRPAPGSTSSRVHRQLPSSVAVPGSIVRALRVGAVAGAATLAGTSTGSTVVAAALLAAAIAERRSALAVGLATAAVAIRFATTDFEHLAGLQTVLGSAVKIGPATGAASAWLAAAALLLAVGRVGGDATRLGLERHVPALASGLFAAAVAVGAGPGGEIWLRVAASVAAVAVAWLLTARRLDGLTDRRRRLAVLVGLAAVVCAGWPS